MKHIVTINEKAATRKDDPIGCRECPTSCQSACKTSCTVGNQVCIKSQENNKQHLKQRQLKYTTFATKNELFYQKI